MGETNWLEMAVSDPNRLETLKMEADAQEKMYEVDNDMNEDQILPEGRIHLLNYYKKNKY